VISTSGQPVRTRADAASPIVAIMQPYFMPAPTYLSLLHAADVFVFFDDVQFVRKRWTHRNRIAVHGQELDFSVPLDNASQRRTLNEIGLHPREFPRWRRRFLDTLAHGYGKTGNADVVLPEVAQLLEAPAKSIAELSARSVTWAARYAGVEPQIWLSSDIDYDRSGKGQDKVLSICACLGARGYVNAPGGRALYDHSEFEDNGVSLRFIEPGAPCSELSRLSILHAILKQRRDVVRSLVAGYSLTE
jgi:hypothetical protein